MIFDYGKELSAIESKWFIKYNLKFVVFYDESLIKINQNLAESESF